MDMRFPIGDFKLEESLLTSQRADRINTISTLPESLDRALDGLDQKQIDTRYRPEGWTIRQVVHHIADSHLNAHCRFKLALTEEVPTIRAYREDLWAELPDSGLELDSSLQIIRGVHTRWAHLLKNMSDEDFAKELNHPESGRWTLEAMTALYDWHSRHHTAHITELRKRMDW
jgi:hypothetical protein